MVRTLDFHSKNVGSNPSSPKININKIFFKENIILKNNVIYSIVLKSLISPYSIKNLNFFIFNLDYKKKKILIKQSYLMLTWFYYINAINFNTKKKIKFFIISKRSNLLTLIKAPMAHKSFSKEQFSFYSYTFILSFKASLRDYMKLDDLNKTLLFVLLSKKLAPSAETNLIFLKNFKFLIKSSDSNFFSFNKFFS